MSSIRLIQNRWVPEILFALGHEPVQPVRFNRLMAAIEGISDRVLTERLRDLATEGLVHRQVEAGPPVQVRYSLTAEGVRYLPALQDLQSLSPQELERL